MSDSTMGESLTTLLKKSGVLRTGISNKFECLIGTGNKYGARLSKHTSPLPLFLAITQTVLVNSWRLLKSLLLMRSCTSWVFDVPIFITPQKTESISSIEAIYFSRANGSMVVVEAEQIQKIYFRGIQKIQMRLCIQAAASKYTRMIPPVTVVEKNGLLLARLPRYRPIHVGKAESLALLDMAISETSDILRKVDPDLSAALTIYNQIAWWWERVEGDINHKLREKTFQVCEQYVSMLDQAQIPCHFLQHGDFWPENILFTPEPVVIDFDSLLRCPRHYDAVYYILSLILYSGRLTLPELMDTKSPPHYKASVEDCRRIVQLRQITSVDWVACENLFLLLKFAFCFSHNSIYSGKEMALLENLSARFDRFPNESSWVSSTLGF